MEDSTLFGAGLLLVFVGFVLAFIAAFVLMFRGSRTGSKVRGGGIVMLGPFPIIFGTDRGSVKALILLSILLMIAAFAFMWFGSIISK